MRKARTRPRTPAQLPLKPAFPGIIGGGISPAEEDELIYKRYGSPKKTIPLVALAALGGYIMMLTLATALQLRLTSLDEATATTFYSRIIAVSGVLLLFAVPLVGAFSDRTTSRFGRRRPWIVIGYLGALICMFGIGTLSNYILIGICYVLGFMFAQVSFNVFSVIPVEGIPNRLRGTVMGIMGMFGAVGMPIGAALAGKLVKFPILMMTVPVLLAIIGVLPLLVLYKDPVCTKEEVPEIHLGKLFSTLIVNPRKYPNFGWVWFSRFLAGIAMTAMLSFFVLYLVTNLHYSPAEAGTKASLLSLYSAPVSIVLFSCSGWVSDKIGRRKPFVCASAVIMSLALIIAGFASDFNTFVIAWIMFAVGQAMFLTVSLALCAQVLPSEADAGKDMSIFALALNIPNIVVPAVAPYILGGNNNYQLFWAISAVLCFVGGVIVLLVKGVK